jgi:hypothetical protein
MATGNGRRRLLRRKQKARELKARCHRWQAWEELERAQARQHETEHFKARLDEWIMSTIDLSWSD